MFAGLVQHLARDTRLFASFRLNKTTRCLSTAFNAVKPENVLIDVGSHGSVSLDIHHPSRPASGHPVILYLSQGPLAIKSLDATSNEPEAGSAVALPSLAAAANATVVNVHYRWDVKGLRWPTPLHDVLAAYDWVAKHLASNEAGQTALGVCGEFLGGSLATALALTEGRKLTDDGPHIRAAVLGNPITDWTAMYSVAKPKPLAGVPTPKPQRRRRSKKGPSWEMHAFSEELPSDALLRARNTLFTSPQHCFDPFASPLLFFRSPGIEVPTSGSEIHPFDEWLAELDGRAPPSPLSSVDKRRRAHRRYPPADSDLIIPHTRLWLGDECVLKDQGIELANSIDRNVGTQRTSGITEERAAVHVAPGLGLWGSSELAQIGSWFGNILWHDNSH